MFRQILAFLLLLCPALAWAEPFALDLPPGEHYLKITVPADGSLPTAVPFPLVVPRGSPTKPPPVIPVPTAFSEEVRKQTAAVIAAGGSKTTAAGMSAVYSLCSGGVADGSIATDKAFAAVKAGSDAIMAAQADKDKWTAWRTSIGTALTTLQGQGLLTTKEQIAGVLKEISVGIDKANGQALNVKALGRVTKGEVGAYDTDGKADGILDGIDLAKLIELIKLLIELFKIFGGG